MSLSKSTADMDSALHESSARGNLSLLAESVKIAWVLALSLEEDKARESEFE